MRRRLAALSFALSALACSSAPPTAPATTAPANAATATTAATPESQTLSPEEAAWQVLVKRKVRGIWIVPPGFRTQPLVTRVVVSLDAQGNILGDPRITQGSGNPWYDESVIRGLAKASPLPPPEPGDWAMSFEPGDSL